MLVCWKKRLHVRSSKALCLLKFKNVMFAFVQKSPDVCSSSKIIGLLKFKILQMIALVQTLMLPKDQQYYDVCSTSNLVCLLLFKSNMFAEVQVYLKKRTAHSANILWLKLSLMIYLED